MTQQVQDIEMGRTAVSADIIEAYRADGFVKVPHLLTTACAARIRQAALGIASGEKFNGDEAYRARLTQQVNIWQTNEILKPLTMCRGIAAIAEQLTGAEMRLWHDHLLSKSPKNGLPTEWHQDQPYWPFQGSPKTISVWIALQDTPVDLGCMSFIPGTHKRHDLTAQNLSDARSMFGIAPELEFEPKVTLPLKAGDATFHNGLTAHMANANLLDEWRIAHVIAYMENGTRLGERAHQVTRGYSKEVAELNVGDVLDGTWFPRVAGVSGGH